MDKSKRYSRKEIAEMFDTTPNTIYRWEKQFKLWQPVKLLHSREVIYYEEHIKLIKEFLKREMPSRAA